MTKMKEFLLIGQAPQKINATSVKPEVRQFYQDLLPLLGSSLVYPRAPSHRTFCATLTRVNDSLTLSLCNPDFPQHFQNTHLPNLLFFNKYIDATRLRLMPNEGGHRPIAIYHAIASRRGAEILAKKQICFAHPLWTQYSTLVHHLFIQEIDDNYKFNDYLDLKVQAVNSRLPETEDIVWVNPVCLRLGLNSDEVETQNFDLWNEKIKPLGLEPLFPDSVAPRIHFYQYGEEKIRARKSAEHLSRIEKLIWGDNQWQAFAALDVLQGWFHLDNESGYYWQAPKDLSPNARFFANYWLERWHGKEASFSDNETIRPPSYTKAFRCVTGSGGVPLNNNAFHDRNSLFAGFSLYEKPVFQVIEAVLEKCPQHIANDLHSGYLTIHENQGEQYSLNFNAQAYLYEFARRYIIPISQISVDFPPPHFLKEEQTLTELCQIQKEFYSQAIKGLRFDPIYSTFHGARGFFQHLCESLVSDVQVNDQIQALGIGWWNHWHEWLYNNNINSSFMFELPAKQSGPRVGQAKVGEMTYLGGRRLYRQTQTMCF